MYNAAGLQMSHKELAQAVRGAYETLTTGDLAGVADVPPEADKWMSPVNRRTAHRELAFRDAQSWSEYQERFGDPDLFGSIVGEVDRLARDVAQLEILGPYPKATLQTMQEVVTGEKGKASSFLQNVFDQVTGHANQPDNETFAAISATNRTEERRVGKE